MNGIKMDKKQKSTWVQYGIFIIVAITLYATGLHTEVIAFAQRGVLATGLMNPDIKETTHVRKDGNQTANRPIETKADFNFELIDAQGGTISFAEYKGQVIFMNIWATWCPPCIAEMPSIDKLHEEMGDDIVFVMLSLDQNFEKAKNFNARKGYDLPIYAPANNLPEMFQSSSIPRTYVIDPKGNLVLTHKGMADYNDSEFKKFLKGLR